jgi:hypothetical protein
LLIYLFSTDFPKRAIRKRRTALPVCMIVIDGFFYLGDNQIGAVHAHKTHAQAFKRDTLPTGKLTCL